jgi:hypothetical protein
MKLSPVLENAFRRRKRPVGGSWRMDETYIKVKGQWKYLYRAVDKAGNTVDFLAAARKYFEKSIDSSANCGRRDISLNGGCSINHSTAGIGCPTDRARATRRTGASPVTQTAINSTAARRTLRKWRSTPEPGDSREAGALPGGDC